MLDEEAELLPCAPAVQQDERQVELLGTTVRNGSQGLLGRYAFPRDEAAALPLRIAMGLHASDNTMTRLGRHRR